MSNGTTKTTPTPENTTIVPQNALALLPTYPGNINQMLQIQGVFDPNSVVLIGVTARARKLKDLVKKAREESERIEKEMSKVSTEYNDKAKEIVEAKAKETADTFKATMIGIFGETPKPTTKTEISIQSAVTAKKRLAKVSVSFDNGESGEDHKDGSFDYIEDITAATEEYKTGHQALSAEKATVDARWSELKNKQSELGSYERDAKANVVANLMGQMEGGEDLLKSIMSQALADLDVDSDLV
jgi:hypothetical protein